MKLNGTILLLAAAAGGAAFVASTAEAKGRGRGQDRVHARVQIRSEDPSPAYRRARLTVERRSLLDQSMRLQIAGAESGQDLALFVADDTGTLVRVASVPEHGRGAYVWEVRTRKGDALPLGVADVANLGGRAFEVRTGSGATLLAGILPVVRKSLSLPSGTSSLDVGLALAGAFQDGETEAKLEIEEEDGVQRLEVEVEHAAPGLAMALWIADASGAFVEVGDLEESDDESDLDEDDDGDDDDVAGTVSYELDIDSATGLPLGAASLGELAGLAVEIRLDDGTVVASGFMPDVVPEPGDDDEDEDDDDHGGAGTTGGSAAAGAATYAASCVQCHGVGGAGTSLGPSIAGESAGEIFESFREGEDGMPIYASLTRADAQDLAAFLRDPSAAPPPPPPPPPPAGTAPTYDGQIRSILDTNCAACHGATMAAAGIRLDSYAAASANAAASLASMQAGRMPPAGALPAATVQMFADWVAGGATR